MERLWAIEFVITFSVILMRAFCLASSKSFARRLSIGTSDRAAQRRYFSVARTRMDFFSGKKGSPMFRFVSRCRLARFEWKRQLNFSAKISIDFLLKKLICCPVSGTKYHQSSAFPTRAGIKAVENKIESAYPNSFSISRVGSTQCSKTSKAVSRSKSEFIPPSLTS